MKNLIFLSICVSIFVFKAIYCQTNETSLKTLKASVHNLSRKRLEKKFKPKTKQPKPLENLDEFLRDKLALWHQDFTIIGPSCIPLISKNIYDNPYHSSLLSRPNAQVRRGHGSPTPLPINSVDCPADMANPCALTISKAFSLTVSDSYSISFGDSKQFSKSVSNGVNNGTSNTNSNVIGHTVDKSLLENVLDFTSDQTLIDSLKKSLKKTFAGQTGVLKKNSTRKTPTLNYLIQDKTASKDKASSNTLGPDASQAQWTGRPSSSKNSVVNFDGEVQSWQNHFVRNRRTISPIKDITFEMGRANARGVSSNFIDFDTDIDSISVARAANNVNNDIVASDGNFDSNSYKIDNAFGSTNDTSQSNTLSQQENVGDSKTYSKEHSITKIEILTSEENVDIFLNLIRFLSLFYFLVQQKERAKQKAKQVRKAT